MPHLRRRTRLTRSRGLLVAAIIVAALLVVQMILQIVGAVIADRGIDGAARDTYAYVGDLMSERVAAVVDDASDVVVGTASEISRGGAVPETPALVAALAARLAREPSVASIFVGLPDSSLLAVARDADGYSLLAVSPATADGQADVVITRYDANLAPVDIERTTTAFDLANRPWYTLALASDRGAAWSDPYVSARTGEAVVSPAIAAYARGDRDAAPLAVVGADLDTDRLAALLDDIPIGEDASAFVLTSERVVVAAPQSARADVAGILERTGQIATAEQIGLPEPSADSRDATGDALTIEEGHVSLERSLDPETGLDWTLRLEANAEDLTPGLASFKSAAFLTTAISLVLVVIAAGFALRIWRPVRTMRQRASTDALTGLANRYEFERQGAAVLARAAERNAPVLLVTFDLDNFKALNDSHGHDAGDLALRAVGRALGGVVRARDVAARLGGDEFAAVMALNDASDPRAVAERVRVSVEAAGRAAVPGARVLGVTAGYATPEHAGYALHPLLTAADDALVAGKRHLKGEVYAPGEGDPEPPEDALPTPPADSLRAD